MTAFLADGDPPSDRPTMVFTPHTEGHTSGRFADPFRVDKTLVSTETLHGTQPAVEVSVAADFSALIDHRSTIQPHHAHQPSRTSSVVLPFAIAPDFINEFNAFYDAFIQSPTYVRAQSIDNRPSIVDDDDDDDDNDDTLMSDSDATTTSTQRLRLALRELEQVNWHIFNILEKIPPAPANDPSPTTTAQPSFLSVADTQQPTLYPEPPRECAPQSVVCVPPPAPDPVAITAPANDPSPTTTAQPSFPFVADTQQPKMYPEPPRDGAPQSVIVCVPPPAPDPAAIPLTQQAPPTDGFCIAPEKSPHAPLPDPRTQCRPTRHSQSTLLSIPNWAKPAVPPPTPMIGVVYAGQTHWPPPRPPKPAPFKKKPQIKPALVLRRQEKDSLRPP